MKRSDEIDQLLHEAGKRWLARQPDPPDLDMFEMRRLAAQERGAQFGRVLFGAGAAGLALVLLVASLPQLGDPADPIQSPSLPAAADATLASPAATVASPAATPRASKPPPRGRLTWFQEVSLSDDRQRVHLTFIGGAPYEEQNACTVDYAASAEVMDDVLEIALWKVAHREQATLPPMAACAAVGYFRELYVRLSEPFNGYEVRDLAGYTHFLSRPEGLVELQLPDGWRLRSEGSLVESPTGRWRQTYSPVADPPNNTSRGKLDFYQAFNGPVHVEGADEQPAVQVSGGTARLWTSPEDGELVLVWHLGGHGLALVANERDFSVEELIGVAETARLPDPTAPSHAPPSSSPEASASDRLRQQAEDALARWSEAVAAAGDDATVFVGSLTSQIGSWEERVGENNKPALYAGLLHAMVALPADPPPPAEITWSDGTTRTVALLSAEEALADLVSSATGSPCDECVPLQVTAARLSTATVQTSRGAATTPVWVFTLSGTDVRVTHVAVADKIPIIPPAWDPYDTPLGLSIRSARGRPDSHELVVSFTGSPSADGGDGCGDDYVASVVESALAVVVIVTEADDPTDPRGPSLSIGAQRCAVATLAGPLGERAVLEVRQGLPVSVAAP